MKIAFILVKLIKSILFGEVKVAFLCFKLLPLNIEQKFESLCHLFVGERALSSGMVRVGSFLVQSSLDFHDTTFSVLPSLF